MTFEPRKPAAGKTGFDKSAHDEHLIVAIEPKLEEVTTQYGDGTAAHCSYVVCLDHDEPTIDTDPMMFGTALVPALTDAGDELVVGRLGQASGKAGRAYWLLYDPSEEDLPPREGVARQARDALTREQSHPDRHLFLSASMLCSFCEKREADDRFREVIGWEQRRSAGGLNKIIARKATGRVACTSCLIDVRAGLPVGTPKLFEP